MAINDLEQTMVQLETMRSTVNQFDSAYWNAELLRLGKLLKQRWPDEKQATRLAEALIHAE